MPKVSDAHRQQMRYRIQMAALTCARRQGVSGMTMNDIIRESGLSAGAIYGYFSSKDELINSLAADLISERFDVLDELQLHSPMPHPLLAVSQMLDSIPEEFIADGLIVQIWGMAPITAEISAIASNWIHNFTDRIASYTRAWLEQEGLDEAAATATAAALAPTLIGMAQGYIIRRSLGGPDEAAPYHASLAALAELVHAPASAG